MIRAREGVFKSLGGALVVVAALGISLCSAHHFAGSVNDGSRFATVEALVDRGTFAIDHSLFVEVPSAVPGKPGPYNPNLGDMSQGTTDKVFINGHYYSHQGPVPALLLAALYQLLQWTTGLTASQRPDLFCYGLTLGSSGLAYTVAVWCVWRFGSELPWRRRLTLVVVFALGTLALPYVRYVNHHMMLLGVAAPLLLTLDRLAMHPAWVGGAALLGLLVGLGYSLDQAAGPPLLLAGAVVVYRCRSLRATALFVLAALPWLLLHHVCTYFIGGTLGPYAAVPEYFRWPGSPFDEDNLTGVWRTQSLLDGLHYAAGLLLDRRRGFLLSSLPLFLLAPGLLVLWRGRRQLAQGPELAFAAGWCLATWLLYALGSTNYSGCCCSVRWFVPLLAGGFYLLSHCLRLDPRLLEDLGLLGGWSILVGALQWYQGAWMDHSVVLLWMAQAAALLHWAGYRLLRHWRQRALARPSEASAAQEGSVAACVEDLAVS